MTSCRHHSGYLADDEAGHSTYVGRVQPPKKSLFPEMRQASKWGHTPHPPSSHGPSGSSGLRSHRRNPKGPRPFRSFLDFLVERQVLDSLQTVVEEATERMATVKTEAGVPLVEVQDPMEVPRGGRRARARPSLSAVHRHRARPSLCVGRPDNYPSCSTSMSDSHSSFMASWRGSHGHERDPRARGLGPLPPMKDRLLLERSLQRLLQLENRGKGLGRPCHGDSLPWDSLGSQTSSQWALEQPLSWFSGLLGSRSGMAEASEPGPAERELVFLKRELTEEMKSLLSRPGSFDPPGYSALREPHRTLDFLAEHHLFPALQSVVSQAVHKLCGACRRDGCPLFPTAWEPAPESSSKPATPTDGGEPCDSLPTTLSGPRLEHRKRSKHRGRGEATEGGSPVSSTHVATTFRLEVTPTEEPKVPSPHPRQQGLDQDPKVQRPAKPASGPSSSSQRAQPWRGLHLTLPAPGIAVEVPSRLTPTTTPVSAPLASPRPSSSHRPPGFSPRTSTGRGFSPSPAAPYPESPSYKFTKEKTLPSILSKSTTVSHLSDPWHEELVDYLKDRAVSLLAYKYRFEKGLTRQLGFISFPVAEALVDLSLGFKTVKGSRILPSSTVDWSCLLRRLEEAKVSQRSPRRVSRHTSQHSSPRRSMGTPTTPSELAARTHRVRDKLTGSRLNMKSPGPRLLSPQKRLAASEQGSARPLEPELFLSPANTGVASHQSEQTVDMEGQQNIREEEEDKEADGEEEEEEEDQEEEEEDDFGDEDEAQISLEPRGEAAVSSPAAGSGVGHGDPP